jgi:hypothetical protein
MYFIVDTVYTDTCYMYLIVTYKLVLGAINSTAEWLKKKLLIFAHKQAKFKADV